MGENSKIEWTDHTFNPWIGCQKVSPGCDHCYAETQNNFRKWNGGTWGPHAPRKRTSPGYWKQPLLWALQARETGARPRVFCASLADVFDNQAPDGAREDLWRLIRSTPELDWLLLTKRPENIAKMLPADWGAGYANVWLGTTAEDQEQADRRGRILRSIPARVRFFSCEPMLGPITIEPETMQALDQVICGGESGGKARPMHPDWPRSLRDQCALAGVQFFFKQWGNWHPEIDRDNDDPDWRQPYPKYREPAFQILNLAGGRGFHGDRVHVMRNCSKKSAGRLLDGIEHNGFPQVAA